MRKNYFKRARTANLTDDFKISYNATSIKIVRGVGWHPARFRSRLAFLRTPHFFLRTTHFELRTRNPLLLREFRVH